MFSPILLSVCRRPYLPSLRALLQQSEHQQDKCDPFSGHASPGHTHQRDQHRIHSGRRNPHAWVRIGPPSNPLGRFFIISVVNNLAKVFVAFHSFLLSLFDSALLLSSGEKTHKVLNRQQVTDYILTVLFIAAVKLCKFPSPMSLVHLCWCMSGCSTYNSTSTIGKHLIVPMETMLLLLLLC